MDRKSLVVGILIGMAIVGCLAAVSGEYVPLVEGRTYHFHGPSGWLTNGTIAAILSNAWVQTTEGDFFNMAVIDYVVDVTPAP